ncbi:MAG: PQQ-binding-like beta-propeller repeat protein [Chloroflexota bacterium]
MKNRVILGLAGVLLLLSGCTRAATPGWGGLTGEGGVAYSVSSDRKVAAVDLRSQTEEWSHTMGGAPGGGCTPAPKVTVYAPPLVTRGKVYIATYEGEVWALNPAARKSGADFPSLAQGEWVYPPKGKSALGGLVGEMATDGDTIYLGSSDGHVYGMDAASGDIKWKFKTEDKVWSAPLISGSVVYATSFDGKLYALSASDGRKLWDFTAPAAIASPPAVSGDTIFFGTFSNEFFAVNNKGAELWRFQAGNWIWARPLATQTTVYAASLDGKLYALDARSGSPQWSFDSQAPIAVPPLLIGDTLVVANKKGTVSIVSTRDGKMEREVRLSTEVVNPLVSYEGTVYIKGINNRIYAVDISQGRIVWEYPQGGK